MTISNVGQWSTTEALNTDLADIPLGEGITRVPHFNNAIRVAMAQWATWLAAPSFAATTTITWGSSDVSLIHSANQLSFTGASNGYFFEGPVLPFADDGGALGSTARSWSDLFLAPGAVVNYGNGDVLVTHSTNALAWTGASNGYSFDAAVKPSANDAAALGVSGTAWADLFLASGAVINFNAGDVTITHSANALAFAGASSGYSFDAATTVRLADDGAGQGPLFTLDRNSASPAASDSIGFLLFAGRDSGANVENYAGIRASILDPTATSEDAVLELFTALAGTLAARANIAAGLYMTGATGGDKGAGTINATAVYDDNVLLTDLVLDMAVTGDFDREAYAAHPIAAEVAPWWFDVDAYTTFWRDNRHLPGMVSWLDASNRPSLGEQVTRLTATVEVMAAHIDNLNQRLKRRERE